MHCVESVTNGILGAINRISNENSFREGLRKPDVWYYHRHLLRYTLYEYELWLLESEGKGAKPRIEWRDLNDATLEHILPQEPDENSAWKKKWSRDDIDKYLHDISNIVLTKNNSNYKNFDFERKKGNPGTG